MTVERKTKEGIVISDKMAKTAVVEVVRRVRDPIFGKFLTKKKKFKVHDEKNECAVGDRVAIQECKPISKTKRWVVTQVVEKGANL
ncbi:30S ribosomal protein S17 [bacterium]|nr:30S ribosomal protein S17 [bacterium]